MIYDGELFLWFREFMYLEVAVVWLIIKVFDKMGAVRISALLMRLKTLNSR